MVGLESLKKNYQFRYVYNKGKSIANRFLVMYVVRNNKDSDFLGVSVSKKVGKSVRRSRVTRLIKENMRLMEHDLKKGFDIVIIARVSAGSADFYDIKKSLAALLKKHKLIEER